MCAPCRRLVPSQEDQLVRMSKDPAYRAFCKLAIAPDLPEDVSVLTTMHAGWAAEMRSHRVPKSVMYNVQTFIQQRPAVLHV